MKAPSKLLLISFLALTVLSTLNETRKLSGRFLASEKSAEIEIKELKEKICEQKSMLAKLQENVEQLMTTMANFIASTQKPTYQIPSLNTNASDEQIFKQMLNAYQSNSYFAMTANYQSNNFNLPSSYSTIATIDRKKLTDIQNPTSSQQVPNTWQEYEQRQFNFADTSPVFNDHLEVVNNKVPKYSRSNANSEQEG